MPRACRAFLCAHKKELLTMRVIHKRLLKLAIAYRAQLAAHRGRERVLELPTWSWDRCAAVVRQIRRAELRGWNLASDVLRRDLASMIPPLVSELAELGERLAPSRTPD